MLSVPSKIFCRVLLHRIKGAIDGKLRQDQEGFWRGKDEQIIYSHICVDYIEFTKALDSIHHSTLWKIQRHYGLPQNIVDLISILDQNFE